MLLVVALWLAAHSNTDTPTVIPFAIYETMECNLAWNGNQVTGCAHIFRPIKKLLFRFFPTRLASKYDRFLFQLNYHGRILIFGLSFLFNSLPAPHCCRKCCNCFFVPSCSQRTKMKGPTSISMEQQATNGRKKYEKKKGNTTKFAHYKLVNTITFN